MRKHDVSAFLLVFVKSSCVVCMFCQFFQFIYVFFWVFLFRYGEIHPFFFVGSLEDVLKESLQCRARDVSPILS